MPIVLTPVATVAAEPPGSGIAPFFTFFDAVEHLTDLSGGDTGDRQTRVAHRAVRSAYRTLPSACQWSYYYGVNRVLTSAPYATGTVAFDLTGGAYERLVTLTGGSWPTWAAYGVLLVENVMYQVDQRVDGTRLTLMANSCPSADFSATAYSLNRDTYTLPADWRAGSPLRDLSRSYPVPSQVEPAEWLASYLSQDYSNIPQIYCLTADPKLSGRFAIRMWPASDAEYPYDQIYLRQPVTPRVEEYSTGTIAVSAGSAAVTGTGTNWTSKMEGSVMRLVQGTTPPTGLEGFTPYDEEMIIQSVNSATSITLKNVVEGTYSGDAYLISDLLDIEPGAMLTAFLRRCELEQAMLLPKDSSTPLRQQAYLMALKEAMAADYRQINEVEERSGYTLLQLRGLPGATNNA